MNLFDLQVDKKKPTMGIICKIQKIVVMKLWTMDLVEEGTTIIGPTIVVTDWPSERSRRSSRFLLLFSASIKSVPVCVVASPGAV